MAAFRIEPVGFEVGRPPPAPWSTDPSAQLRKNLWRALRALRADLSLFREQPFHAIRPPGVSLPISRYSSAIARSRCSCARSAPSCGREKRGAQRAVANVAARHREAFRQRGEVEISTRRCLRRDVRGPQPNPHFFVGKRELESKGETSLERRIDRTLHIRGENRDSFKSCRSVEASS